jgi:hypothetical protein
MGDGVLMYQLREKMSEKVCAHQYLLVHINLTLFISIFISTYQYISVHINIYQYILILVTIYQF